MYLFIYHDENVNENKNTFLFKGCHGILFTVENLKSFFPPSENQSAPRTKLKIFHLNLSQTKPKVVLWQLSEECLLTWKLVRVTALSQPCHGLCSLALLPLLDGKLQGFQEGPVQPGLWTPLWIWGAHTTFPMATEVGYSCF